MRCHGQDTPAQKMPCGALRKAVQFGLTSQFQNNRWTALRQPPSRNFLVRTKTPFLPERMLDAAARLFATQRFHEVRMEDIAAEADVGKGTLYRYFNDKEELYLALLDRASRQLAARLHEQVAESDEPRRRLQTIVAALIQFFDEQPHLLDVIQRAEVLRGPDFPWKQTRDRLLHM